MPPVSNPPATVSAPMQPHETELERKSRLLSKVRVMRDGLIQSQANIEGRDPDKAYCWVNCHDSRVVYYEGMGYTICRDPKVTTRWKREDGSHRRGDVVLMEIPKDMKEAWDSLAESNAIEALEGSKEGFKEFAGRNGVPVFEPRPQG